MFTKSVTYIKEPLLIVTSQLEKNIKSPSDQKFYDLDRPQVSLRMFLWLMNFIFPSHQYLTLPLHEWFRAIHK